MLSFEISTLNAAFRRATPAWKRNRTEATINLQTITFFDSLDLSHWLQSGQRPLVYSCTLPSRPSSTSAARTAAQAPALTLQALNAPRWARLGRKVVGRRYNCTPYLFHAGVAFLTAAFRAQLSQMIEWFDSDQPNERRWAERMQAERWRGSRYTVSVGRLGANTVEIITLRAIVRRQSNSSHPNYRLYFIRKPQI